MKRKQCLFAFFLASTLAVGVGTSLTNKSEVEVNAADTTYKGSIAIEFQEIGTGNDWAYYWDSGNAKVAFYAFNNSTNATYGWSEMIATTAGTHNYEIPYSFTNDPFISGTQFHLIRFNSNHSDTPDWNDIWNRYDNVNFSQLIYIYNNNGNAGVSALNQTSNYIKSDGSANNVRLSYNKFSTNIECYNTTVSLSKGEKFTINFNGVDYFSLKEGVDSTYFSKSGSSIMCNLDGTYDFYFDTSTKELWVQVDATTEASGFAATFLSETDKICSTGSTSDDHSSALSSVWTTLSTSYSGLTSGAKSVFADGTANETIGNAHDRYIHIMSRYSSTLTPFTDGPSYLSMNGQNNILNQSSNITYIVIVSISASFIILITALYLRKRKIDR